MLTVARLRDGLDAYYALMDAWRAAIVALPADRRDPEFPGRMAELGRLERRMQQKAFGLVCMLDAAVRAGAIVDAPVRASRAPRPVPARRRLTLRHMLGALFVAGARR